MAIGRGGALKIKTFLGPEMATHVPVVYMALGLNHYVPRHKNSTTVVICRYESIN